MGLIEQIQSGSPFYRGTATISYPPAATGYTTDFGATYILLGISTDNPCRIRLYANSSSVAIDALRPSSSFDYSASVALNLDVALTPGTQSLTFNPPVFATTTTQSRTFYNIESPTSVTANISYYPIEFLTTNTSRRFLNIPDATGVTLTAYQQSSGNFSGSLTNPIPKSFLIIGAVCASSSVRLRLYSQPIEAVPVAETTRPFATLPTTGSHLISDMVFDSASYFYDVSPILQAYNLEDYLNGSNRVGYIIENLLGSTQTNITAGVRIYPIED